MKTEKKYKTLATHPPTGKTAKNGDFMVVDAEFSGNKQEPFNPVRTGKKVVIES